MSKPNRSDGPQGEEIDFSAALANAGTGTTLQVRRAQPAWCDGILCEEEIDPRHPVDIEQIREQWGGRKLILTLRQNGVYKTATTVKFPDPPKKNGVIWVNPDAAPPPVLAPPAPPPPPDDSGNKLLEIVLGMQNQQAAVLAEIQKTAAATIAEAQAISAQTQQQTLEGQIAELKKQIQEMGQGGGPQQGGDRKSALDGIKEMASTMKEIEEIRGSFGGSGGGEESSLISEGIKSFMALEMEKKKFEMNMMMEKMKMSQQGQGGGTTAPPLEERPKIEAGQPAEESAPLSMAAAAPMLQAFGAMDTKQQAQLVGAHIEQLDEDKRIEFLEQLSTAASDFIEREEEEEEDEDDRLSCSAEATQDKRDDEQDEKTIVDDPAK